jgi:hypothetical protein
MQHRGIMNRYITLLHHAKTLQVLFSHLKLPTGISVCLDSTLLTVSLRTIKNLNYPTLLMAKLSSNIYPKHTYSD